MSSLIGDLLLRVGADQVTWETLRGTLENTLESVKSFGESIDNLGFSAVTEGLLEFAAAAGVALSATEAIKDGLHDFANEQDVITSFTLLTGSAEDADAAFESLKETSQSLAVPFASLLEIARRLAPQFGVGTPELAAALQAAGDAAAATGRDLGTVADGLDRIAITGQVSTRQMVQFGVSIGDIAEFMGVSVTDAQALLKKGGEDAMDSVNAVTGAIEQKFGGAAQSIAENMNGQFTKLKNDVGFILADLGAQLEPVAVELLQAFKDAEPIITATAGALSMVVDAVVAVLTPLGALGGILDAFGGTAGVIVAIGTAFGYVGVVIGGLITVAHAAVLEITDLLSLDFKQFAADWTAGGAAIEKAFGGGFDAVNAKADALNQKLANIKIPVEGDTVVNEGAPAAKPDFAANLDALNAQKDLKGELTKATRDLAQADADYATYLRATFVPALTDTATAEQQLHDATVNYTIASNDEQNAAAALAIAVKTKAGNLKDLEAVYASAHEASMKAHADEEEARKTLTQAKTVEATVTKDLQGAEDAIAAAARASYIPAILDHQTALENVGKAQADYQAAIEAVRAAEENLRTVFTSGTATVNDVKAAEDALAATKRALQAAVTNLHNANKDLNDSQTLLAAATKELDAGEKQNLATKKLLQGSTTDVVSAVASYEAALDNAKRADDDLTAAEKSLKAARDSGIATGQELKDAENQARTAREASTTANQAATTAQSVLTGQFHLSADALIILKDKTGAYTDAQKDLIVELSAAGVTSHQVLQKAADDADTYYGQIKASGIASSAELRDAYIADLGKKADALAANGLTLSATEQITLADLKAQAADFKTDQENKWGDLYNTIDGDVKTVEKSMVHTLFTGEGSFKDEALKGLEAIGEAVVTAFVKPFEDAVARLIAGAITDLLSGKGLGGILSDLESIGKSAIDAVSNIGKVATPAASGAGNAGSAAGSAGSAGGGAGGAGGEAAGGVSGLINVVTGAITAISSVIGIFQNMHQETSLNAIELNTRITAILLGSISADGKNPQDADNIKGWLKVSGMTLGFMNDFNYNVLHPDLVIVENYLANLYTFVIGPQYAALVALKPPAASTKTNAFTGDEISTHAIAGGSGTTGTVGAAGQADAIAQLLQATVSFSREVSAAGEHFAAAADIETLSAAGFLKASDLTTEAARMIKTATDQLAAASAYLRDAVVQAADRIQAAGLTMDQTAQQERDYSRQLVGSISELIAKVQASQVKPTLSVTITGNTIASQDAADKLGQTMIDALRKAGLKQ